MTNTCASIQSEASSVFSNSMMETYESIKCFLSEKYIFQYLFASSSTPVLLYYSVSWWTAHIQSMIGVAWHRWQACITNDSHSRTGIFRIFQPETYFPMFVVYNWLIGRTFLEIGPVLRGWLKPITVLKRTINISPIKVFVFTTDRVRLFDNTKLWYPDPFEETLLQYYCMLFGVLPFL